MSSSDWVAKHAHDYRGDIDGLRAVAVISVLLFHLGVWPFTGGFAGVDVFFVISGYLITRIIYGELLGGSFSLANFYERRIRRIFPALYLTIGLTIAAAAVIYEPHEHAILMRSLAYLAVFMSNFYFMDAGGYFDAPMEANPVLQTWSLSVEEQYYLAFPLILMLGWRYARAHLGWIVVALAALSLGIGAWRVAIEPEQAFFATEVRIVELMIGAIVALGLLPVLERRFVREAAAGLGGLMMFGSLFALSADVPFPGPAAMPVCIGTALIIWAGERGTLPLVNRALAMRPMIGIGLISYSVYLLHWPLIVFAKRILGTDPGPGLKVLLAAVSLAAGYLSWRFVEKAFRRAQPGGSRRRLFAAAAVLIAALGGGTVAAQQFLFTPDAKIAALAGMGRKEARANPCLLGLNAAPSEWSEAKCSSAGDGPLVAIWGDSYAAHYFASLRAKLEERGARIAAFGKGACPPAVGLDVKERPTCRPFNDMVIARIVEMKPKVVVLSAHWLNYEKRRSLVGNDVLQQLRETVRRLTQSGLAVVVIGPSPVFPTEVPFLAMARSGEAREGIYAAHHSRVFDQLFSELAGEGLVRHLPAYRSFCDAQSRCRFRQGAADYYFWDTGHMTRSGADVVIGQLFGEVLAPLLAKSP